MAFLLYIGYIGLKCPFLAQEVLIGLKKGLFIQKPAFLMFFCFITKHILLWKILFLPRKVLVGHKTVINPKKGRFWAQKAQFWPKWTFFAPEQPSLVSKMVIYSLNQLLTWHFCSILAILAQNALFWPRKCSLVSKRAYFDQN